MHYQTHYSQVSNEIDNNRAVDKSRPNSLEWLLRMLSLEEVKLAARTTGYLKTIIMMSAIARFTDHEWGDALVPVLCVFFCLFVCLFLFFHNDKFAWPLSEFCFFTPNLKKDTFEYFFTERVSRRWMKGFLRLPIYINSHTSCYCVYLWLF